MNDDIGHEIVRELGIAPALDVDDDQRLETLRRFHEEDAQREAEHQQPEQDRS
ncbi:MAG: hypothetical protein ACYDGM_14705 [Vulcanimicrobiaceae bacterium]